MPPANTVVPRPSAARQAFGIAAILALVGVAVWLGNAYLSSTFIPRPPDFLQVWAAGRLTLTGGNPYDGEQMFELQAANRIPSGHASMMWVPPWGLALAMPIGALPIGAAQAVWVYGQLALIVVLAVWLWNATGGDRNRRWVPALLALGFGAVWHQTVGGQYAGVLLLGVTGFYIAGRANRPVLAGVFVALTALKPHLFVLLAIGLIIDAIRTPFGRRVVFGGATVFVAAVVAVTVAAPGAWAQYAASATGAGSRHHQGLADWFNPTIQAWVRHSVPGHPLWVQFIPIAVAAPLFAIYWWRHGVPDRWPSALIWIIPVGLLLAPYGSWPPDLTLLLLPTVAIAARLDAVGWPVPRRYALLGVYAGTNVGLIVMQVTQSELADYVWVAPILYLCVLWASRAKGSARTPTGLHSLRTHQCPLAFPEAAR